MMACCSRMQWSGSLCDGGKTTCSEMDSSQLPHKAFFCFTVFLLACSILHYNTDDYYHIIFLDSSLEAFKTQSLLTPNCHFMRLHCSCISLYILLFRTALLLVCRQSSMTVRTASLGIAALYFTWVLTNSAFGFSKHRCLHSRRSY